METMEKRSGEKRLWISSKEKSAAAIGAPVCVIHTISSIFHGPDADPKMMQRLHYEMFTGLLPYAKEKGVKIATETFGDANCAKFCCLDFFGSFDNFMEGYHAVKNTEYGDYFTVCIDTGHCNKAMRFGEPNPADFIRRFGSAELISKISILSTIHFSECMRVDIDHA